jgi:choline-sulfatase
MIITGTNLWNAASFVIPEKKGTNDPQSGPEYHLEQGKTPIAWWPQYMKQAGYDTYFTGKWHISADPEKLFDYTVHIRPRGMPDQSSQSDNRTFIEGEPDLWSPYDTTLGGYWKGGKHWSEEAADDVIGFLRQAKTKTKPFFMYIGFNAPHDPRQSPKQYVDMYQLKDIAVPKNFLPVYPYALAAGSGMHLRDERLAPMPRTEYSVKKSRQEYYAIITHLDAQIGRILDELESSGQKENTYIFFTADNGLAVGDHGFMGKNNMYDASMRVPLIISGPGVSTNKRITTNVYLQDIMPTTLEIAGINKPSQVEFHSLLPLATGKTKKGSYEAMYGAYFGVQRMIRTKRYKMIIYPVVNVVRLYDLKNDPNEITDLAALKKYRKRMDKLFAELQKLQVEMKDPVDVSSYYHEYFRRLDAQ